jgi:uroporphyrinogen III methyltransferase/synthase
VASGLRSKGWTVDAVTAYRTVDVGHDPAVAPRLVGADAVTFLSGSAARSFVEAYGSAAVPPVVACIGPSTATVCRRLHLPKPVVAEPHTVPALVRALAAALKPDPSIRRAFDR